MTRALLLALAACTTTAPSPTAPRPAPVAPTAPIASPAGSSAVVGFAHRTQMIESRHGGGIVTLATTTDGTAALTVDELGGARLWPVLDGSREPRVVDLPRARALALGLDPRGFLAAAIDVAGGLSLAIVDRDGLILQRASLPADPAFVRVVITSRGVIALRADHSIVRLGSDGAIVDVLRGGSGERITALAARGDKVVVQVERSTRKLRWLTLAPALTWGAWIPSPIEPEGVVELSPSGESIALAVGVDAQRRLVLVDTGTGAPFDGEAVGAPFGMAFSDEQHVALWVNGQTRVHAIGSQDASKLVGVTPEPTRSEPTVLVAGGGRAIGMSSAELVIVDRTGTEYLGYDIDAPTVTTPGPAGSLLVGLGTTFVQLDSTFASTGTPTFQLPASSSVAELVHLDDSQWLVEWGAHDTGRISTALVDTASTTRSVLRSDDPAVYALAYEPRSRLVTLGLGEIAEVYRYVPRKKQLAKLSSIKRTTPTWGQTALMPLAPALANGNELLSVAIGGRLVVRWARDARTPDQGTMLELDGTYGGADRVGNVYVWTRQGGTYALVVVRDGKQVAKLPTERPVALSPDPEGKRYLEISQHEVALVAHDGTRAWTLAVSGVSEAHWLGDGGLALVGVGGIARVDAATGAVQAARCGWRFGLTKTAHRGSSRSEPLCTQLR